MKAIVQNDYGTADALSLKEVADPVAGDNQVLVKVHASSLNAGDLYTMRGSPWLVRLMVGFPKPKDHILGWDVAGTVAAVGAKVTQFQPGDAVYGSCSSAFAEYVCVDEEVLEFKPANLTFEQAAAVPTAGLTALQGLRDAGKLQAGQKVLINGASGGVGTFAIQITKALGAEVTGVCSPRNLEMVRSLGADHVIDYTREDFTRNEQRYDLILDNVANRSFRDLRQALTPQGVVIPNSGAGGMAYVIKVFLVAPFTRQVGGLWQAAHKREDLATLKELIEAGKVSVIIDKTFPLSETADALRTMDKEHARGKIIIKVAPGEA